MSRTRKDSRALAALSPNAREHAEKVLEEREHLRRWREDVRAGRALPAAGDLLADVAGMVGRTVEDVRGCLLGVAEPAPVRAEQLDAFDLDLFGAES